MIGLCVLPLALGAGKLPDQHDRILEAPLQLKGGKGLRPGEQEISFTLEAS
jgi:hypothetical protein